jgi:hypothetical protein
LVDIILSNKQFVCILEEKKALIREVNKYLDDINVIVSVISVFAFFEASEKTVVFIIQINEMEREVNRAGMRRLFIITVSFLFFIFLHIGPNSKVSMTTKLRQYKKDVEIMQRDLIVFNFVSDL